MQEAVRIPVADEYHGDDLGVTYFSEKIRFRIWSPTAEVVQFLLFKNEEDSSPVKEIDLERDVGGTWLGEVKGDFEGFYYLFRIQRQEEIVEIVDPYAKAVGTDSKKGLIVNLKNTDPEDWENDKRKNISDILEAVIYELHVRDFSSSPESGIVNKGKYLAFTEKGTRSSTGAKTGIDHLRELGITHVHLLPVFDFATVSDNGAGYNWGYDPYYYNVPEGSYAGNPADDSRIKEFKLMVQALHENDIGVIMDVAYNHTYYGGESSFEKMEPGYFHRRINGFFANGSGCGNEVATERPMVRKFIVDSVRYWAEEYHIDGFRFDLMALIDRETMKEVKRALKEISPSIIVYGEPWAALTPQIPPCNQMNKGSQRGTGIAIFNDDFRDAVGSGLAGGYNKEMEIKKGIVGAIDYCHDIRSFAEKPEESINYASCHDNLTLWDKISSIHPFLGEWEKIKLHRLIKAVILTSQGVPFIQGGEEFLRTKHMHGNSYNAGDHFNQLKWERKKRYKETFKYYQGLIKLRRNHPAFRMKRVEDIRKHLIFLNTDSGVVAYKLIDHANEDSWKEIFVFYNFTNRWFQYYFGKKRRMGIVVDDRRSGTEVFNSFEAEEVKIPPISAMVLRSLEEK